MKAQCYYQYSTCDDGTGYIIYANLEDSGNLMKYATAQESIGGQKIYAKGNCTTLGDTNLIGPDSWY